MTTLATIACLTLGGFASDLTEKIDEAWSAIEGKSLDDWSWRDKNRFVGVYEELAEAEEPDERDLLAAAKAVSKLNRRNKDDIHYQWRVHELVGTLYCDAGQPKKGVKELESALELYPHEDYADPLRQSSFQHLVNEAAGAKWDVLGVEHAEDFALELLANDSRLAALYFDWWRDRYFSSGESDRLPSFVERAAEVYDERGDSIASAEAQALRSLRLPVMRHAGGNERMTYFLFAPKKEDRNRPRHLVLTLPGGNGQALDFLSWMTSIQEALGDDFVVAILSAPRWNEKQAAEFVWVTEEARSRYRDAKFSSEAFVDAVHEDIEASELVTIEDTALMGWSSGGPPTYASVLRKDVPYRGAFVLASVFRPTELDLKYAAGKRFFLAQGTEDRITPPRWAEAAEAELSELADAVQLEIFEGGHGFAMPDSLASVRRMLSWVVE